MKVSQPVSVNGNRQYMSKEPDPQVIPKAERRKFSAEYKLRILAAPSGPRMNAQNAVRSAPCCGERGLYSSNLDKWRKQRERGALEGLAGQKRGRKPDPQASEIVRLQRALAVRRSLSARRNYTLIFVAICLGASQIFGGQARPRREVA